MSTTAIVNAIGILVVLSPASLLLILGLSALCRIRLSENTIAQTAKTSSLCGLIASLCILTYMLTTGVRNVPLELGNWVALHHLHEPQDEVRSIQIELPEMAAHVTDQGHAEEANVGEFHFRVKFVFDRLSVPFVIMSFVLCGIIGAFAFKYLHLEPGFNRFFLLYSVFQLGMILSSLAGTIETLFFGWEMVGLASALLVAYYHDRPAPVQNGLRVWAVYRIADAAFLMAALALHHLSGAGDFDTLMGQGDWPLGKASISENQALLVGTLLLIAAAGKSALVPFSGWLPRAMEGPTPSSAVFYGALSVHLGAFLLLRFSSVLETSWLLSSMVIGLGFVTMVFASMATRVQSDVKSALAYASLVQVSIIVIEIGFGLRYIPLIHIIGHACVRTLQLVRAPSTLRDYSLLENAIGDHLPSVPTIWQRLFSLETQERFYRFAWERGYLDAILDDYIVRPFANFFRLMDRIERRCEAFLSGKHYESPNAKNSSVD